MASESHARLDRLEGYLRQDPTNVALLSEIVDEALRSRAVARAEAAVETAHSLMPPTVETRHLLATIRLSQGSYEEAAGLLQTIVEEGVNRPEVHFNLAYAMFRAGRILDAKQRFEKVLGSTDAPAASFAYLLRCLHHLGEITHAIAAWESAAKEMKTLEARGVASLIFFDAHRLNEAAALAESTLAAGARSAEANVALAGVRLAQSRPTEAFVLLDCALALNDRDGRTWSTMGAACLMQGEVDRALDAYQHATQFLPRHIGSWHGLAWCNIFHRDLDTARTSFERAMSIDRGFADTHGGMAVVAALQGREADAEASIARAERLDRDCLSAKFARAVLSGEVNEPEAFERFLRTSVGERSALLSRSFLDYLPFPKSGERPH